MRYQNVFLNTVSYVVPEQIVTTHELESQLEPLYRKLHIPLGQLEVMTGIQERRWWPEEFSVSDGAIMAGKKALALSSIAASDLDALVYTGVCRDHLEPATACRVADQLGLPSEAWVYDISNACLGVLNGIVDIANRIELGQISTGMVVACESAGPINRDTIAMMLGKSDLETFKHCLATLTGGSGATALILTSRERAEQSAHQILGGTVRHAARYHQLCRWTMERLGVSHYEQRLATDAIQVLNHGVRLGLETWRPFIDEMNWRPDEISAVITHQVGKSHREAILRALEIPFEKDFSSFAKFGNMGTVSLPMTLALAAESGFFKAGDRVSLLGIGSGLNCLMLGVQW